MTWLDEIGHLAGVVEWQARHSHHTHDLFGFADVVAIGFSGFPTAYIQVTTASHHADRRRKVQESEEAERVYRGQNGVFVVSWKSPEDDKPHRVEYIKWT